MLFNYATLNSETEATMFILNYIGVDASGEGVHGETFAKELATLEELGIQKVTIRINSKGGSVEDGWSIYSAIKNSTMEINTEIWGWCWSMATPIACAGKKVSMTDFSLLMVHNVVDGEGNTLANVGMVKMVNDGLVTVLAAKTGKPDAEIATLMDKTSWMRPKDALKNGFIDEIITTNNKLKINPKSNTIGELDQIFNKINEKRNNELMQDVIDNEKEVSTDVDVTSQAQTGEDAKAEANDTTQAEVKTDNKEANQETERSVDAPMMAKGNLFAVEIVELNNFLKNEIEQLRSQIAQKDEQIANLLSEKEQEKKAEKVVELIENAVKAGKIKAESKASWLNIAKLDFDTAKNSLESISPVIKSVRTADVIKNVAKAEPQLSYRELEKTNSKYLMDLYDTDREAHDRLYNACYGKNPKI